MITNTEEEMEDNRRETLDEGKKLDTKIQMLTKKYQIIMKITKSIQ